MARMSDQDIVATAAAAVTNSANWLSGTLTRQREQATKYYRGDPFGNEVKGRSQVVSRDVAQQIDTMMPSFMRIFGGGDEIVRFEPMQKNDEQTAQQATDYVNWIWTQQNNGFVIFHDWFKDALLNKLGTVKIWWDDTPERVREVYEGLSEAELRQLGDDPDIEIGEVTAAKVLMPGPDGLTMEMPVFGAVVTKTNRTGRVRVEPVPPEEFIFGRRAKNDSDAGILGHRAKKTKSQLLEMGYDADVVDTLFQGDSDIMLSEVSTRFDDVDDDPTRSGSDSTDDEVEVIECYLRMDVDGDDRSEYVKVCYSGTTLLDVEEVDDHPFANITPIPMPHRMVGLSVADQVMDIQLMKSTIWRQTLDNLYLVNTPQMGAVVDKVNIDDLLTRRVGGVVRMKEPGALFPIPTQSLGSEPYQMIEYLDTTAEQRTGATRYNQGLDANTLNKTATGINLIQNAAAQRIELVARVFAETGVKRAFRRILQLVCKHQQKARVIRLRGEWVEMDPRAWRDNMDMTVTVGLGTGNRDQIMAHIMTLLQVDAQIAQGQGGFTGPVLTWQNIYAKLKKLLEAAGLKGEGYYTDPGSKEGQALQAQQGQKPDPKMVETEAKIATQQAEAQARQQIDMQKAQHDAMLAEQKMAHEMRLAEMRLAAEMEIAKLKAGVEAEIARMKASADAERANYATERQEARADAAGGKDD